MSVALPADVIRRAEIGSYGGILYREILERRDCIVGAVAGRSDDPDCLAAIANLLTARFFWQRRDFLTASLPLRAAEARLGLSAPLFPRSRVFSIAAEDNDAEDEGNDDELFHAADKIPSRERDRPMTRTSRGNDDRFHFLYVKYYRRVVLFYVRVFRVSEDDAKDLAQDTFMRFFAALDEYRGEAEWAFLETIARNVGFNRVRAQNTAKRSAHTINIDDPEFARHEPAAPEGRDLADRQHDANLRKQLHDAIAQLPSGQRQCVQLWLEDFKYDEIAKALRISMDAVRSRLRDAKRLLRERLGEDNALPEDYE